MFNRWALVSLENVPKISSAEAFPSLKGTFWTYRYTLPITNILAFKILGNTNTPSEHLWYCPIWASVLLIPPLRRSHWLILKCDVQNLKIRGAPRKKWTHWLIVLSWTFSENSSDFQSNIFSPAPEKKQNGRRRSSVGRRRLSVNKPPNITKMDSCERDLKSSLIFQSGGQCTRFYTKALRSFCPDKLKQDLFYLWSHA